MLDIVVLGKKERDGESLCPIYWGLGRPPGISARSPGKGHPLCVIIISLYCLFLNHWHNSHLVMPPSPPVGGMYWFLSSIL